MKKFLIAATMLVAGTAAIAQDTPEAAPVPAPARPMHDKVMTRGETVEMVREHFGRLDADKDGSISREEVMSRHLDRGGPIKAMRWKHADGAVMSHDPNAAFDRLDANKDGSISRDEFATAREERIERRIVRREKRRADSPKDSKEVRKHVMRRGGHGFGARMIVMADTDQDGRITQAEAEAMALRHFDQMDANKDGQVTPEERRAGRPMIIKHIEERSSGS